MSEKAKIALEALIPGGIMAIIAAFTDQLNPNPLIAAIKILIIYLISIFIVLLFDIFWGGYAKAKFDLWRIGKIRGLWKKKGLVKQISNNFYSANDIKIKVTRGHELLKKAQDYGFQEILENLKDGKGKKHDSNVVIKFLLILPCFKEEHVTERFERHTDMSQAEFLETWYEFIKEIRKYNTEHLSINVRFYFDNHARWRFYIFSKPNEMNTTVLLSDYDKTTPGRSQPMYKIIKGEQNIGTFMINYFDELWGSSITPQQLYNYIEKGKCKINFCAKCNNDNTKTCDFCKNKDCKYIETCKSLVKKYENILTSFNAGGNE